MRIDGRRKEVEGKARKWEEEGEGKKVKEGGGKRPPPLRPVPWREGTRGREAVSNNTKMHARAKVA